MALIEMTVTDFVKKLASDSAAPGGGSAAALSGVLGASLVSMVCRLTKGKEKYAEFEELVTATLSESDEAAQKLLDAVVNDTKAFDGVMAAFAMPKSTDEEKAARSAAIQAAYKDAVASPEETARLCLRVMCLAKDIAGRSNSNAASDLSVGAMQAYAGLMGALDNVRINLPAIKDRSYADEKAAWADGAEAEASSLLAGIRAAAAVTA